MRRNEMARYRLAGLSVAALLSLACGFLPTPVPTPLPTPTPTPMPPPSAAWQAVVDDFARLNGSQDLPAHLMQENPEKTGGEFDVSEYFSALDRLSMEPGYALDYVYVYDGMGAYPVLYVRPEDQPPYATYAEYAAALEAGDVEQGYLDHIQTDGTEEGFFQFVLLRVMGGQFYLFWHAGYYDDAIVCSQERIEAILSTPDGFGNPFSRQQKRAARTIDPAPVVEMEDDVVVVKVVVFTKWGGFSRETYTINRSFPHTILDSEHEVLVTYDCGIMF
jgi:hypothetical protein